MLGCMAGNTASTPRAHTLGSALREARESKGLSLRKVAAAIERDPSELSRWELGKRSPGETEVAQILGALGIGGARYEQLIALARNVDAPQWLAVSQPEQRQQLNAVLDFEAKATDIVEMAPLLVPGVLQTSEYIRAIMSGGGVPANEIETRVAVRIGRRDTITRSEPVQLLALVGEAALRHVVGSRQVMARQLRYLLELAELPNVDLRAVPFGSGWNPVLEGAFTLITTAETGSIVHLETRRSGLFLHEPQDVESYREAADTVLQVAMSPTETTELIAKITNEMETT
jgi:transcriptional regulator with XRE-family HTH domain